MEPEKREYYKTCPDLDDFEETIHELQAEDFYYAKPSLMKNKNDGKVLAVYTLTDECASIFPISPINVSLLSVTLRFVRITNSPP